MKTLFILLICLFSGIAHATESGECISREDAKKIKSRFNIQVEHNEDLCDPKRSYTHKIIKALLLADGLELNGPKAAAPWNQEILPSKWLNYLQALSSNILGSSRDYWEDCDEYTRAYVRPQYFSDTMFVCKRLFSYDVTEILGVLLHEARHHQGYDHVNCQQGSKKGFSNGCDESIHEKGSYAVSVESSVKMGITATNLHPAVQKAARGNVLVQNDSFNAPVYNLKYFTFLKTDKGEIFRFNGKNLVQVQDPELSEPSRLFPRSFGEAVVFPQDVSLPAFRIGYATGKKLRKMEVAGTYMRLYNSLETNTRSTVTDLVYASPSSPISAWLQGSTLEINYQENPGDQENTMQQIVFSEGVPTRIYTIDDLNATTKNRIYVTNGADEMFRIEILKGKQHQITKIPNPIQGYKYISKIGNKRYALNPQGQVMQLEEGKATPVKELVNHRFTEMSRALMHAEEMSFMDQVTEGDYF